ncbi:MAG TPA: UDP-N-acetylmuramate:L-alanyl-gamma-D-glutamyl-meso-diaminopimelate ligase [Casimicrobiaceae bacterium]|nr:UDP-N-acetylmuramate:L-alanyl-gamma-D-glutamyl-meso-diaminopimelate ligase [Casimicrobiaceae bacterium]
MHLHVLGICGTFMGGLAALAKTAGHRVTGCDANVYPPMSTQLRELGIELTEGYGAAQLEGVAANADLFIVGNVITRGNPLMEAILDHGLAYTSGPEWLRDSVLAKRFVLAVAGTHGKTTAAAMLVWILEHAGLAPGFLIGGVPLNFGVSARHSDSGFFVIEADEYDTAFFDKRSKFVHYRPRTAILNNLEYDHADIFPDLAAIETQFHHLVRTVPASGKLVVNAEEASLARVLARGAWSAIERFAGADIATPEGQPMPEWRIGHDGKVTHAGAPQGYVRWPVDSTQYGRHTRMNALAAIVAARHAGVPVQSSLAALAEFRGVKRRLERIGQVRGVTVYDDFAHHPTAIATTIAGLKRIVNGQRVIAVLEPRSNTMKLGAMKEALARSLREADHTFCYAPAKLGWDVAAALAPLGFRAFVNEDVDRIADAVASLARNGDHVVVMSNGSFGGVHEKILAALVSLGR